MRGWRVDAGVTNHEAQTVLEVEFAKMVQIPGSSLIAHRHGALHDPRGFVFNTVGQHDQSSVGGRHRVHRACPTLLRERLSDVAEQGGFLGGNRSLSVDANARIRPLMLA